MEPMKNWLALGRPWFKPGPGEARFLIGREGSLGAAIVAKNMQAAARSAGLVGFNPTKCATRRNGYERGPGVDGNADHARSSGIPATTTGAPVKRWGCLFCEHRSIEREMIIRHMAIVGTGGHGNNRRLTGDTEPVDLL